MVQRIIRFAVSVVFGLQQTMEQVLGGEQRKVPEEGRLSDMATLVVGSDQCAAQDQFCVAVQVLEGRDNGLDISRSLANIP